MKRLAIIGASYLQRPLVLRAKEMGLYTICFAWEQGAVCKDLCDLFYPVSITEKEQILALCRKEQTAGIRTSASDVTATTVACVAQAMGLAGNSYEAALRAHDKHAMRDALSAAGVDCPGYEVTVKGEGVTVNGLTLPLIVKPTDRSGSLGVTKVERWENLQPAIDKAQETSMAHEALVEEFIEGREISVEMISCQGVHYALQITDKTTTDAPHFVELAHHQPSDLPCETQARIFEITKRALDALGLTSGASHSEYKITLNGRIVVMEIGGRMGGDFIGSDLVQLSTGYDFLQGVIEVALGETIHPQPRQIAHAGVYFVSGETPEVLPYIAHAKEYKEIVAAEQTDSELRPLTCSADRSGYFLYQSEHGRFETLRGKTVMVLGGGRYQLPLIRAGREAGCRVLVMGWPGDFPGYHYASRWYNVDIMDAEGDFKIPVNRGKHLKYDLVGKNFANYDSIVNLAHGKGHIMGGFGANLKNQSIGIASRNGKAYIHSCGQTEDPDACWHAKYEQIEFIESMAEAAKAVADYCAENNKKILYITVMNAISTSCDCDSNQDDPVMADLGIVGSTDPVANDQAFLDLIWNSKDPGKDKLIERITSREGEKITAYAEKIGLGSTDYELVML